MLLEFESPGRNTAARTRGGELDLEQIKHLAVSAAQLAMVHDVATST